ncbi:MAG: class I SAM-dependent methyltransferase [Gemmatimonadaceae bacterium]|nr:class I SAM-dependent methyltransferase [Gemmatimonadaceae bacterium]
MTFHDHFSARAADYAQYRPSYPAALFHYLAAVAPATRLAWDAGTGNGQAATALADRFAEVVGTDPSAEQLKHATRHPRVRYAVSAGAPELAERSVDLITVAQALHWFDLDAFLAEAKRVAAPRAVLAVWGYTLCRIEPRVDELLDYFYRVVTAPYWAPERRIVDEGFRSVALPIDELAPPQFEMRVEWTLSQLIGYLSTWSAVRAMERARGPEPMDAMRVALAERWGTPGVGKRVFFPLALRCGELRG